MNNKEKQQAILNGCGIYFGKGNTWRCNDNNYCKECKQKLKTHKEEVMKGCGEIIGRDSFDIKIICGKLNNLCPTCQAIIDKYKENGI